MRERRQSSAAGSPFTPELLELRQCPGNMLRRKRFENIIDPRGLESIQRIGIIRRAKDHRNGLIKILKNRKAKPIPQLYIAKDEIGQHILFKKGNSFLYRT